MDIEKLLEGIRKPGQYLGNEWNVVKKDIHKQRVKFAICFPDLYEVGMSHVGLRIIYGLLNAQEGIACERVFLPDIDMQEQLRMKDIPIFSLESRLPLSEFDIIGFCLNYELDFTNILAILDLAGIPLLAKERGLNFPLIIGGGCSAGNPEPLADFFDLFLIGEAEEALVEIVNAYQERVSAKAETAGNKDDVLRKFAKIEGVYAPSLYKITYDNRGKIQEFIPRFNGTPGKIKKRIVKDLNTVFYPVKWLVPYVQIVHDRAAVEIMRGCPHLCGFCQARSVYHNVRVRSKEKVLEIINGISKNTGYEEISLLSLSSSDYPFLQEIVAEKSREFQDAAIALSFPSLRPRSYFGDIARFMSSVRKTTLTFAPEAGTQRLRNVINKDFDLNELFEAVSSAYKYGWQSVKLYFMICLPTETEEDLDGILDIAKHISDLRKDICLRPAQVNLSISFFIPKPHTKLERQNLAKPAEMQEKKDYLKNKIRKFPKCIKLNFHDINSCLLEGIFSRGDRRLGAVLLRAYQNGCKLDGWTEHFKYDAWLKAFQDSGIDPQSCFGAKDSAEALPWGHIEM